ncbi:MAG: GIY-YIG nuclease family protein [Balneolaceae bacterium]
MKLDERHHVYILTNHRHTVLYTGKSSDLVYRIWSHKNKVVKGFTKRYNVDKLVYFEELGTDEEAIFRERQIKAGSRKKKIKLIESINPKWKDLSEDFEY